MSFGINIKMCGKMSFVFGLLIAIVVFSSASKRGSYIYAMKDEEYDVIKRFLHFLNFSLVILMYQ